MELSMNEIRMFAECPLKYKFYYKDKYKSKPDRNKEFRQSLKAIIRWFFDKIRTGNPPGKREMRQKWGKIWHKDKTAYDIIFDTSYKYEHRRNLKGVKVLDTFYDKFIEEPGSIIMNDFDFRVGIGNGHVLKGNFDLVREIKNDNTPPLIQLINWRTDHFVPYQKARYNDIHLTAYDYAFRILFERIPDQLVYYSFKNNKFHNDIGPMRKRHFNRLISSFNNIATIIENELYYPRQDEQHNICRYCNYLRLCTNWS